MKKTELVIFKHQRKKLDSPSRSVKYLGIKIHENLNWKQHIHDIAIKLNRANALLYTIRNFVNRAILRAIYFAVRRVVILQKKALRIMNLQSIDSHSSPLFKSNHTLKLEDKILI